MNTNTTQNTILLLSAWRRSKYKLPRAATRCIQFLDHLTSRSAADGATSCAWHKRTIKAEAVRAADTAAGAKASAKAGANSSLSRAAAEATTANAAKGCE